MKNFKNLVFVVVALILVAPACKTNENIPVGPDDIQFTKVSGEILERHTDFADVKLISVIKVKTSAETVVNGTVYIGSKDRPIGSNIPNTNGQWYDMSISEREFMMDYGSYEIWGVITLESTGKTVESPHVQFDVTK